MNEKWYKSVVVLLGTIMSLIQAIGVVYMVGINPSDYDQAAKILHSFAAGSMVILVIIFMGLSLKKKKAGPILGMVTGLVYLYKFTVPALLIGVAFFAFSLALLVELGKESEKKEEKPKKEENKKQEKAAQA